MYTIIRLLKLHGRDITASDNHCHRRTEVANANPALQIHNKYLNNIEDPEIHLTEATLLTENIQKTIEREHIIVPRKDSVKCIEILMAMPPELWQQINAEVTICEQTNLADIYLLNQWSNACLDFLREEPYVCGGRTFLDLHLHMDESTPHIHAHIMPGEPLADGKIKLNAKKYFNGRQKLQQLQDRYYSNMHFRMPTVGFQRGIKKEITGKSHVAIKEYYKVISLAQKAGLTPENLEALIRSHEAK